MLFAVDCCVDVTEAFKVDQPVDLVLCREVAFYSLLVLKDAPFQVASYAGVEGFTAVGHDVDIVEVGRGMHGSFACYRLLCKRQTALRMTKVWGYCM